jgi:hypothetical protein
MVERQSMGRTTDIYRESLDSPLMASSVGHIQLTSSLKKKIAPTASFDLISSL